MYKPPILIDEVQKAPELFERIKIICDATDEQIYSSVVKAFEKEKLLPSGFETRTERLTPLHI